MDNYTLSNKQSDGELAFDELYSQYAKPLFFHVYELTEDEELSLKVVKDTFEALYEEIKRSEGADLTESILTLLADTQLRSRSSAELESRLSEIHKFILFTGAVVADGGVEAAETDAGHERITDVAEVLNAAGVAIVPPLKKDWLDIDAKDSAPAGEAQTVAENLDMTSEDSLTQPIDTKTDAAPASDAAPVGIGGQAKTQIQGFSGILSDPAPTESDDGDGEPDAFDTFFNVREQTQNEKKVVPEQQTGEVFGSRKIKHKKEGRATRVFTVVLCVLLVCSLWFIAGQLMHLGVLPELDLGYSAFNSLFNWSF